MPSLEERVSPKSSGGAFVGMLTLTSQPGSVLRLILPYFAETIRQSQVLRSLAITPCQFLAAGDAFTSAVNSRSAGLSRDTIAGVAKRGRHMAALLVAAALATAARLKMSTSNAPARRNPVSCCLFIERESPLNFLF